MAQYLFQRRYKIICVNKSKMEGVHRNVRWRYTLNDDKEDDYDDDAANGDVCSWFRPNRQVILSVIDMAVFFNRTMTNPFVFLFCFLGGLDSFGLRFLLPVSNVDSDFTIIMTSLNTSSFVTFSEGTYTLDIDRSSTSTIVQSFFNGATYSQVISFFSFKGQLCTFS